MENLVLDLENNNNHIVLFFNSHHLSDCIDMVMMSKSFVTFPLLVLGINPILLQNNNSNNNNNNNNNNNSN